MSGSIWLITYDVASNDEARYLDWFHRVHIPEKLARPGYLWAAHYEVVTATGAPALRNGADASGDARGFLAIFGGDDTRTFLNPSPAQIKPTQPPLTREMMGLRVGSQSLIATEEWRVERDGSSPPSYAFAEIVPCDTGGHDEDYGAWCIQTLGPHLLSLADSEVVVKLLATTAAAKHIRVASFGTLQGLQDARANLPEDDWSQRVEKYQAYGDWQPVLGRRIWPQF